MDFHCRVMFTCVYTHVNFIRVNRIEARHKLLNLNVKLSEGSVFTFTCDPSYFASILFANVNFTHLKLRNSENPP